MTTVILDTNYWISLKEDSDVYQSFRESKGGNGFAVAFCRPNMVDLTQRTQQDDLAEIIANIADTYIVVDTYNDDGYLHSENPLLLSPPESRSKLVDLTEDFEELKTLRFLFRYLRQDPDESYPALSRQLKLIYDTYGEDLALISTFGKYAERDGTTFSAELSDAHKLEYIRKLVEFERVKNIKKGENLTTNDYVDMEICSYAIFAADVFLSESKWKNIGLVQAVCSRIDGFEGPIVVDEFEEFFEVVES